MHVSHVNDADKLNAFHRWEQGGAGDDMMVVAKFSARAHDHYTIGFPRPGRWHVRFNSDWQGYSADFGNHFSFDTDAHDGSMDDMPAHANSGIGAYSAIILSQDRS